MSRLENDAHGLGAELRLVPIAEHPFSLRRERQRALGLGKGQGWTHRDRAQGRELACRRHELGHGRPGLGGGLGFVRVGEISQHQGMAQPTPLIALPAGWRLRPAGLNEAAALHQLDQDARGMPRAALIDELIAQADACVVLDHDGTQKGFAILRRFGRGHAIGPVVAPDAEGAKALIAHLAGMNAGRFTRIDIDFDSGLAEWLESIGLLRVDAPTTMVRGAPLQHPEGAPRLFAIVTQALC